MFLTRNVYQVKGKYTCCKTPALFWTHFTAWDSWLWSWMETIIKPRAHSTPTPCMASTLHKHTAMSPGQWQLAIESYWSFLIHYTTPQYGRYLTHAHSHITQAVVAKDNCFVLIRTHQHGIALGSELDKVTAHLLDFWILPCLMAVPCLWVLSDHHCSMYVPDHCFQMVSCNQCKLH